MKQKTEDKVLPLLRHPECQQSLLARNGTDNDRYLTANNQEVILSEEGIPQFARNITLDTSLAQQQHYDSIANTYVTNLHYPHTQVYQAYLDQCLTQTVEKLKPEGSLGTSLELCCGTGEALHLFQHSIDLGIGVDISLSMLKKAIASQRLEQTFFVQGDATQVPLNDGVVDTVFMLGGIHHVPNREKLFAEIHRILKPGGYFFFREPVSDFWLWKMLRAIIYRLSPILDQTAERPLLYEQTIPVLEQAGLEKVHWSTYGFLGFCFFMNSDVLWFNRSFRFIPGIKGITSYAVALDRWCAQQKFLQRAGLQVIGAARKPTGS